MPRCFVTRLRANRGYSGARRTGLRYAVPGVPARIFPVTASHQQHRIIVIEVGQGYVQGHHASANFAQIYHRRASILSVSSHSVETTLCTYLMLVPQSNWTRAETSCRSRLYLCDARNPVQRPVRGYLATVVSQFTSHPCDIAQGDATPHCQPEACPCAAYPVRTSSTAA